MMKLLFISDLNGNQASYEFLISQAERFDAMLWSGNLIDPNSGNIAGQQAMVEKACGAIQAKGCRVLACADDSGAWGRPWHWLRHQGMYIAPGLFVTTMLSEQMKRQQLAKYREAAWDAGALWIVLSHGPIASSILTAAAPKGMILRPNAALRFGPDVIVSSRGTSAKEDETDWCERRGHTWIFHPGQTGQGGIPVHVVLDTMRWKVTRHSHAGVEQRDVSVLSRMPVAANNGRLLVA